MRSFEDENIAGLHKLISLAKSCDFPAKLIFCSSTASVLGKPHSTPIPEVISNDPSDADRLGYSQSKWVAEGLCCAASRERDMKGRIIILRIGQLTGDTVNGAWNMSEAWPMMLSTVESVGCLPRRKDKLSWLPLNIAAQAVVEVSLYESTSPNHEETCEVFHIVNNSKETTWEDLLSWIKDIRSTPFDVVELSVWAERIEKLESHPAKNLLWLWTGSRQVRGDNEGKDDISFDVTNAKARSEAMRSVKPVDKEQVEKIWQWIESAIS